MASGDVRDAVIATAEDIAAMEVRGAATIAREAADALRRQAVDSEATEADQLRAELRGAARRLRAARPTAVTLPNALRFVLERASGPTVEAVRESTVAATDAFRDRVDRAQDELGEVGANRLADGDTLVTHCHSTDVLSVVERARSRGLSLSAYVTETRPRRQGRLTARHLADLGVDVTFIADSAVHTFLPEADRVLVGADSVAADGTVVNKVGTRGLAISAREQGVDVVVAAQTLKFDPATLRGHTVDIEHRDAAELLDPDERADLGVDVANPAFDATPPRYVDAIVAEEGLFSPESVAPLMRERYGSRPSEPWEE